MPRHWPEPEDWSSGKQIDRSRELVYVEEKNHGGDKRNTETLLLDAGRRGRHKCDMENIVLLKTQPKTMASVFSKAQYLSSNWWRKGLRNNSRGWSGCSVYRRSEFNSQYCTQVSLEVTPNTECKVAIEPCWTIAKTHGPEQYQNQRAGET